MDSQVSQAAQCYVPFFDKLGRPLVSVIIPTKNSQATLEICLDSIRRQTYDKIEIIIVDSGSRDSTRDIAASFGATIVSHNSKMAAARNFGSKLARGDFLFHMDSDMKLSPRVVEKCILALQDGACAAVVPQIYEGEGFFGKCRALEFKCLVDDRLIKSSRFMTRVAFETVGGYDDSLDAGEDWDITQKIEFRYKIAYIGVPLVHGWGKYSLSKTMRKSYNYGKTVKLYMKKYPEHSRHQWGPMRVMHLNLGLLSQDTFHAIGLFFMKFCEFGAGCIGMMV